MINKTRIRKLEKDLGIGNGSYQLPTIEEVLDYDKFSFITRNPKMTRQERGVMRHYLRDKLKQEKRRTGLSKVGKESVIMFILLNWTIASHTAERGDGFADYRKKREQIEQNKIMQRAL